MKKQKMFIKYGKAMKPIYLDKRKKFVLIFDTETSIQYVDCDPYMKRGFKSLDEVHRYNPIEGTIQAYEYKEETYYKAMVTKKTLRPIFDFGYTIATISGEKVLSRSFLVDETFCNMDVMKQAYYWEKYPDYIRKLANQDIPLAKWVEVKQQLERDIIDYRIKNMYAYNTIFDKSVLDETNSIILNTAFDIVNTYNIEFGCLWGWACETIFQTEKFCKTAIAEGWLSEVGNIKTSAEVCYRYLTQQYDFIESHTALEDSIIETEIYRKLKASGKKCNGIVPQPWALVRGFAISRGLLKE